MPKLRKVTLTENSMSWGEEKGRPIVIRKISRGLVISPPKRELNTFLKKGKKIKKITLELS